MVLFDGAISRSKPTHIIDKRISNVLEFLTKTVWRYTLRGLYETHKFLFTLLLALKIDLNSNKLTHAEFLLLLKGGAALDMNATKPKPFRWMLDVIWLNLVELSKQVATRQVLYVAVSLIIHMFCREFLFQTS